MRKLIVLTVALLSVNSFAFAEDPAAMQDSLGNPPVLIQKETVRDSLAAKITDFSAKTLIQKYTVDGVIDYRGLGEALAEGNNPKLTAAVLMQLAPARQGSGGFWGAISAFFRGMKGATTGNTGLSQVLSRLYSVDFLGKVLDIVKADTSTADKSSLIAEVGKRISELSNINYSNTLVNDINSRATVGFGNPTPDDIAQSVDISNSAEYKAYAAQANQFLHSAGLTDSRYGTPKILFLKGMAGAER